MRKYNPFANLRTWSLLAVLIGLNVIVCVNYDIVTANKILQFHPENGDVFVQSVPGYANESFVPIIMGIALFELFRRIRLPHSRIINFLGSATFMVYLFHDNSFVYRIWATVDWITLLHDDLPKFLLTYFLWTIGTFAVGVLIYALYLLAGKLLLRCKSLAIRK